MGGKALNKYGVHTERKNTEQFKTLAVYLISKLALDSIQGMNPALNFAVVKCYHTKESHGDLDLLIKMPLNNTNFNWRAYIQDRFNPNAIHNNGGVFSFDYENFQIDFIPIKEDKWEIAQIYYSYDPLGNIMGKTFHKFGMSYGWDGLFYKYRNFNGKNSQNILLTTDPRAIFDFGGYNYDEYLKGFDTLEEIFQFTINSEYFDTEMLQMENLKSIDKKRNRKRGSYHLFLNYLKDNNINVKYGFSENKDDYLAIIDLAFPDVKFMDKLEELRKKDAQDKLLSEKFNGNIIMQWLPELKGKELGNAITTFKNQWGEQYNNYIANTSIENIQNCFMLVYNSLHRGKK